MTTGTMLWSAVFFVALIWFVAWLASITTRAYMIGEREKEGREKEARRRLLEQLEKEFYDDADDVPRRRTQRAEAPKKRAVKFVDADEEAEAEAEVAEPKGTYTYDPVAHKVVFTPSK